MREKGSLSDILLNCSIKQNMTFDLYNELIVLKKGSSPYSYRVTSPEA